MIGDKVIENFPCMLASPQKFLDRIKFPAIAQEKADGMRANIINKNGKVYVYSRNGKLMEFHGLFDIAHELTDIVLDGELLVRYGQQTLDRKTGNGILHKAVVGTITEEESNRVYMKCWDAIPYSHWIRGESDIPYNRRFEVLEKNQVNTISTWPIKDIDELTELYHQVIVDGMEGLVVKNSNHPWEDKRSKNCIKMKEVKEIDLKIVGYEEGEGRLIGMLGKFICQNKEGTIEVGVGTGFTDGGRKDFWEDRKNLIGKICSIKYNSIITRKDKDIKSLFLPVFVEIRDDKDTPD